MEKQADLLHLKRDIHEALTTRLRQEIAAMKEELQSVQLSANNETKSSAGDKYETGRAMAQLEIEKLTGLLLEKEKALAFAAGLSLDAMDSVRPGSLAVTSMGHFYVTVNGGEFNMKSMKIRCISPASPLAVAMREKRAGDTFDLMQKRQTVSAVI